MAKYILSKVVIEDWTATVEAADTDELFDMVNSGDVEWEFLEANDEWEIVENA